MLFLLHLVSLQNIDPFLYIQHAPPEETTAPPPGKKVSSKVTKAQRRAQQAEFNRQLWAEAYVMPMPSIAF